MAGGYTILFLWREWRADIQFCLVGEESDGRVSNSLLVKGMAVRYTILMGCREWPAGIQFFFGGGSGGRVYNSVCVEGMAGEHTILFLWRECRADIQFCLVGEESDGRVSNSLLVAGLARACGGSDVQAYTFVGMKGMTGRYAILFGWMECRADIQFFLVGEESDGRIYNSDGIEGMAGGYTILFLWRKWRTDIVFFLVGAEGDRRAISGGYTILFVWRECRADIQFFLVGEESDGRVRNSLLLAGLARACTTVYGWRECKRFALQSARVNAGVRRINGQIYNTLCGGGNEGQVYDSAWLEKVTDGTEWRVGVQFCWGGGKSGGQVCNSLLVAGLAEGVELYVGGVVGGRFIDSVYVVYRVSDGMQLCIGGIGKGCTTLFGWEEVQGGNESYETLYWWRRDWGGAVYSSVWVEDKVAVRGQSGALVYNCLGGEFGGRVSHSICVKNRVAGREWRAGLQFCLCGGGFLLQQPYRGFCQNAMILYNCFLLDCILFELRDKKASSLYRMPGFSVNGRSGSSFLDFILVTICNIHVTVNFCGFM
ncbi:hypothetical protein T01_7772 [Trichinella spiralis]|uniref:Uncharacterized protein n=1 Tax=Trichinella spiralis TaxID=6334 RepID=A0A0V1BQU0_TRISP|nr:hypothetical protein T01_7772 [Trichinella spiralis]